MLQVAIARWMALWPSASIGVLTGAPEALASYGPRVVPVSVRERAAWLNTHITGRFHHSLPSRAAAPLERIERGLKLNGSRPLEAALALRRYVARAGASDVAAFLHWLRQADVVALTGGGALTDAFSVKASQIFDTLGMAARRGRRDGRPITAIFGQGFGPLDDPALRRLAADVLPQIDLIALRESPGSRPLLSELGVRADRIVLTGDDAIELAFEQRPSTVGSALGVNVRVAYYARTDASTLGVVKQAVVAAARRHGAAFVPVPISRQRGGTQPHNAEQSDAASIRGLLADVALDRTGWREPDSPAAVIREVGRCRVVVTGSYHGAVFALAQGIPAIGLAGSPYYRAKFVGLAEQFDGGVQMVEMGPAGWGQRLEAAIDDAWQAAERLRPRLLDAAARQVELSRQAYQTVATAASSPASAAHGGRVLVAAGQSRGEP
jgi:colanic acid/amylovoran biosynthesis protein